MFQRGRLCHLWMLMGLEMGEYAHSICQWRRLQVYVPTIMCSKDSSCSTLRIIFLEKRQQLLECVEDNNSLLYWGYYYISMLNRDNLLPTATWNIVNYIANTVCSFGPCSMFSDFRAYEIQNYLATLCVLKQLKVAPLGKHCEQVQYMSRWSYMYRIFGKKRLKSENTKRITTGLLHHSPRLQYSMLDPHTVRLTLHFHTIILSRTLQCQNDFSSSGRWMY